MSIKWRLCEETGGVSRVRLAVLAGKTVCGLVLGGFTGAVTVVTHASPLDLPWIGFFLATALLLIGGWLAVQLLQKFGAVGYFLGATAANLIFLLFPFAGDITALQSEIASQIWLYAAPLLAMVPLLTVIWRESR